MASPPKFIGLSKQVYWKSDGRYAVIYRRPPTAFPAVPPSLDLGRLRKGPAASQRGVELRWHPFKQEWVILAAHRQHRTFFPKGFCPLCPPRRNNPSEIPEAFDYASFENQFPSLFPHPPPPPAGHTASKTAPARGLCEVIVYTPHHHADLSRQPLPTLEGLFNVWKDRYEELSRAPWLKHLFIFENRGVAVGVTLHHPHGQLYAFSYLPPIMAQEQRAGAAHWKANHRCLYCDLLKAERRTAARVVAENRRFVAFAPFFGTWPYEIHVAAKRHTGSLADFDPADARALAPLLRQVVRAYDRLHRQPMPYIMAMRQAPTQSRAHPWDHWRLEFYPRQRTKEKLKFPAACELAAGSFIVDVAPEVAAKALRRMIRAR